jgi:ribosomal protein L21E
VTAPIQVGDRVRSKVDPTLQGVVLELVPVTYYDGATRKGRMSYRLRVQNGEGDDGVTINLSAEHVEKF